MKKYYITSLFLCVLCGFLFIFTACEQEAPIPRYLAVTGVSFDQTSVVMNLRAGGLYTDTITLTAVVTPQRASNRALVWWSSNPNVAAVDHIGTVNADGTVSMQVRALRTGTVTIFAASEASGDIAECHIEVIDLIPQPVQAVSISDVTLFIGGTEQKKLIPVFTPRAVTRYTASWQSSNASVAAVNQNGVVSAVGAGTATITITVTDEEDNTIVRTGSSTVTVTPLHAQFASFAALHEARASYGYFNFIGRAIAANDNVTNTSTWSGTSTNQADFRLNYTYDFERFGKAPDTNLVPRFVHPQEGSNFVPPSALLPGPYRSHSQFNYASLAHFAFTGYRQAHPWGVDFLLDANGNRTQNTRAGQTWSSGSAVHSANAEEFSGLAVDLGKDKFIDTVVVYAGGNITANSQFNSRNGNVNNRSLGIFLEYMPFSEAAQTAFNELSPANSERPVNWPRPGYPGSPWIGHPAGEIVPNGISWVYVFHFEQPVLARYVRLSFRQAPVAGGGFLGFAFVNSFEIYNTRGN